ncbi:Ger(x)C family spore germination protein [Paenibacillus endoradicis]|uniref:Ger(x)C family spore germination protein n=1 Tax=Paenibacillus endoradicis TaxID=2972487 RepID=UPI0021595600|nr:Ger(x)C family spore germination protein [Paenibacillus endoradicis]MCR8658729.1 Ger(x)C family spore germination protein [Paenibacillus endoradicis]
MNTTRKLLLVCFSIMLLTGCWDQNLLKDAKLVMTSGFDLTKEGKLLGTIVIPIFTSSEGGAKVAESQIVTGEGDTTMDIEKQLDLKISGQFDASKMIVLLFGEDYAKQDIKQGLDVFYRDPRRSLVANAAVVKGRAVDLLHLKLNEKGSMSGYLNDLFESAQADSVIPRQTRPMYSDFYDPATDIILPLLEAQEREAQFIGLALFNDSKYTGKYLDINESTIYMLLADERSKHAEIKIQVHNNEVPKSNNYIYINVLKADRKLTVKGQDPDNISANIQLDLKIEILEDPKNNLDSFKKINDLEKETTEKLTEEANKVIKKLQEANSDSLSIGRRLIAFHNNTWKKIDWAEKYPTIEFEAKVNVHVIKHGIFN